jgi:glycosyltransferase involved in cell wall biosynthesis
MLADCLESVKNVADEIILVDTGSVDKTVEIAERYSCKVIYSPWQDDFAQARNVAIDAASCDYILTIDADERLVNPWLLKPTIQNSPDDVGAWLIRVVSQAKRSDGGADTFVSNLMRLFVNRHDIRYKGIIHEQVIDSVIDAKLTFRNSPLEFVHLGYDYTVDKMKEKQARNLRLLNKALEKDPNHAYNLYNRAKTYLSLRMLDKAEEDTLKVLELAEANGSIRPQAYNYGGIISAQLGKYDRAIERAKASLAIVPDQAFAYFILGEAYSLKGDFTEAYNAYIKMREKQNSPSLIAHIVGDYNLPQEQLCYKIGRMLMGLRRYSDAEKEFQEGSRLNPQDPNNIVGLANIAFMEKDFTKARDLLNKALSLAPNNVEIKKYLNQLDAAEKTFYSRESNVDKTTSVLPIIAKSGEINLSVSMIIKNEEKHLADCIKNVAQYADEVIVVDTGSEDRSKEIALSLGAKVFDFKWINDFAAARNESLKHCNGRWILYLDADERLAEGSGEVIRRLISTADDNIAAYICTIESPHLQLDGSTELHRGGYPRLFRNYGYPTIQFQGRVHEQITPSLFALNKSVDFSDIVIKHLGYDVSREVMEQKIKRNYSMLIQHVQEEPLNSYAWFQLGQTLAQMKIFDQAENAIRMSIEIGSLSNSVYASATATLAQIVGAKKNLDEALFWADKSLEKAPDQIFALFLKAFAYKYKKQFNKSLELFHEVKHRNSNIQGVPKSGFDIVIDKEIIDRAIKECEASINSNATEGIR